MNERTYGLTYSNSDGEGKRKKLILRGPAKRKMLWLHAKSSLRRYDATTMMWYIIRSAHSSPCLMNPAPTGPLLGPYVALGANPSCGLLAPLKTTNCDLRKMSPKMLKPMPVLR